MSPAFRIRTRIGEGSVSSLPWSGGWVTILHLEHGGKSSSYDSSSIAEMSQKHLAFAKQLKERYNV